MDGFKENGGIKMNENGRIGCLLKKMERKKILEAFLEPLSMKGETDE